MKIVRNKTCLIMATIVCLLAAQNTRADSVMVVATEDTTITEKSLDVPVGGETTLDSGWTGPNEGVKNNRALLKFNLAGSIPANAIVSSAVLNATVVQSPTSTNLWFSLRKVLQPWSENAATWTNRLSPPAPWSAPGGAAPLDYSSSVTQSNLITGVGSYRFTNNPRMVANVQDWVANPGSNFGWILICELEGLERSVRKFGSSEAGTTNNRPSLEVNFSLPALSITVLPVTNGNFQFFFNGESNRNYAVEYCDDFNTTNWILLTNINPLPASANVLVSEPLLTDRNRFFRVREP